MNTHTKVAVGLAAAAAAALALAPGLHRDNPHRVVLDFSEGETPSADCETVDVLGSRAQWASIGVTLPEGVAERYGSVDSCAVAGEAEVRSLGFAVLDRPSRKRARGSEPKLRAWTADDAEAPFECLCCAGACEQLQYNLDGTQDWYPVAKGAFGYPGSLRGDTRPTPCRAILGHGDPRPEACR